MYVLEQPKSLGVSKKNRKTETEPKNRKTTPKKTETEKNRKKP